MARPTFLIISQVYVPDPASVGQHLHDVAAGLVARGHRVVVYASARGYDDPARIYPTREQRDGVEIRRLPLSSFGKRTIPLRILGGLAFLAQAIVHGVTTTGLSGLLVSTSPVMCSIAGVLVARLRRVPLTYWMMDVNPDQAIATGRIDARSPAAWLLERANACAARTSAALVLLDRFMAARLADRWRSRGTSQVIPPWADSTLEPVPHAQNPFRDAHELTGRFVLMYSGNLSLVHPVTTVLEAAKVLRDDPRLLLLFVGGGLGLQAVRRHVAETGLENVRTLPYQPLDQLRYSLSAADAHLVSMGDAMVGIVHPCKVYGAMAVARPVLCLGPEESHIGEILRDHAIGSRVAHGDVEGAVRAMRSLLDASPADLDRMGEAGRRAVEGVYSGRALCARFCDVVETTLRGSRR